MTLSVPWSGTTNNQTLQSDPQRLVTFETFDQRDEKTLLPTCKPTHLPTYIPTYLPTYLPPLEQQDTHQEPPDNRQEPGDFYFWHTMSDPRDLHLRAHPQDAILETCDLYDICSEWWGDLTWPKKTLRCCDIWDTDYNTDNWEPEFMTIFVTWQLIVTLDSIRNSCDVL